MVNQAGGIAERPVAAVPVHYFNPFACQAAQQPASSGTGLNLIFGLLENLEFGLLCGVQRTAADNAALEALWGRQSARIAPALTCLVSASSSFKCHS